MMDWDAYRQVKILVDAGRPRDALALLEPLRARGDLPGPMVGLEALCLLMHGRAAQAADALQAVIARGEADYWTWRHLAQARQDLGDWKGVAAAFRHSHAVIGWPESLQRGYAMTHDYFSHNIPDWTGWFAEHIPAAPIAMLEIGSWQGASACWLLDRIVGPRGGRLTCVDTFEGSSEHAAWLADVTGRAGATIEALFDANVALTGRAAQLRKLVGASQETLPGLHGERFDAIYVDGAHEAKFVIQDAVLSWGLLAPGGCLLFDDVPFTFPQRPQQDTARAIDFFLSVFDEDLTVLERGRQLLLRRHGR